jgi:hypothetical protein
MRAEIDNPHGFPMKLVTIILAVFITACQHTAMTQQQPQEQTLRDALCTVLSENRGQIASFLPNAYSRDTLSGPLASGADGSPVRLGEWSLTFMNGCGMASLSGGMIGNVRGRQHILRVEFCMEAGAIVVKKWTIETSNWARE